MMATDKPAIFAITFTVAYAALYAVCTEANPPLLPPHPAHAASSRVRDAGAPRPRDVVRRLDAQRPDWPNRDRICANRRAGGVDATGDRFRRACRLGLSHSLQPRAVRLREGHDRDGV